MPNPVDAAYAGPTVFLDEEKLDFDYVPEELPHREDVLTELTRTFRSVATGAKAQHASLEGPVGSGKTALARRFVADFREAVRKHSGRTLLTCYVNCRTDRTDTLALLTILRSLDKAFPDRGFSAGEMLDALRRNLERKEADMVVILDEADVLLKGTPKSGPSELLYHLSRWGTEGGKRQVSTITASQHDIFGLLDEATASSYPRNRIVLDPYGPEAMQAIVDQRVKLAMQPGTVPEPVAGLIADIAGEVGDARRAIQLLWKAGKRADADPDRDQVNAEDVRAANNTMWSDLPEHKLRELPLHELLVMLAAARRLHKTGEAYAITSEVESTYQVLAETCEEKPRGHTQFWKYLKNLDAYGFLRVKRSGAGQSGTTQTISLPDAPAADVKVTLAAILEDVHGKSV